MKKQQQQFLSRIGHWKIHSKIGEGSFGCIYSAENLEQQAMSTLTKDLVAVKTESITNIKQMLLLQYQIYKQFQGKCGFPKVFEYVQQQRFSYLVMEKFQVSLDKYAAGKFSKQFMPNKTLLQIMNQTLRIIQEIHEKGYLYRDMKPSNLMLKWPYQQIYIIDFGLCKKYIVNQRHIAGKINKKLVGTPVFCSLNTHAGLEQSRRDDLQSWLWTCLYFGLQLPWEIQVGTILADIQAQKVDELAINDHKLEQKEPDQNSELCEQDYILCTESIV